MTSVHRFCLPLLGAAMLAAGGCSVLEPDRIDYKSAGRGVALQPGKVS